MVQTDISQVAAECADWRQVLRNYRNEFTQSKKDLESLCRSRLTKDQLLSIEHFSNQFHIQLINIHDLKKDIKLHERHVQTELENQEMLSEETLNRHEALYDQFSRMEMTLLDLRTDFQQFSKQNT
jgi:hypothetical protein